MQPIEPDCERPLDPAHNQRLDLAERDLQMHDAVFIRKNCLGTSVEDAGR